MKSMSREAGLTPDDLKRFWAKVEVRGDSECWPWLGAISGSKNDIGGYGHLRTRDSAVLAHRVAFTTVHGPIPVGMVLDHTCHTRACVNPAHLQQVTQRQNSENRPSSRNSKSGVRGVTWNASAGKWRAIASQDGKHHHAGYFTEMEDARAAVIALRAKLYTNSGDTKLGVA